MTLELVNFKPVSGYNDDDVLLRPVSLLKWRRRRGSPGASPPPACLPPTVRRLRSLCVLPGVRSRRPARVGGGVGIAQVPLDCAAHTHVRLAVS